MISSGIMKVPTFMTICKLNRKLLCLTYTYPRRLHKPGSQCSVLTATLVVVSQGINEIELANDRLRWRNLILNVASFISKCD
jgi:hypothetical protein